MESSAYYTSDTYFTQLVNFLSTFQYLFTCSNTEYLKKDVLKLIRDWKLDFTNEELNNIPMFQYQNHWPNSLKNFIKMSETLSLTKDFEKLAENPSLNSRNIKKIGIKKQYEIEHLSALIHDTCSLNNGKTIKHLVDLGCGLGYLTQLLHQKYNYRVLGLEGDPNRVQSALKRQLELFPASSTDVKYVQQFIEETSGQLISEHLLEHFKDAQDVALVGLHACADLTITSLKLFFSIPQVKKLVIMPCCYHKLKCKNEKEFYNIPLSQKLTKVYKGNGFINRSFLRLACNQTSSRWVEMSQQDHLDNGKNMFQRGLLECVLKDNEKGLKIKNTKKSSVRVTFQDLKDNFKIMDRQTNDEIEWNEEHEKKFAEIRNNYPRGEEESEFLTCLQTTIQCLCENLILIDRLAFVEEVASEMNLKVSSCIKRLPNDKLSPRCFILIFEKMS